MVYSGNISKDKSLVYDPIPLDMKMYEIVYAIFLMVNF